MSCKISSNSNSLIMNAKALENKNFNALIRNKVKLCANIFHNGLDRMDNGSEEFM
jgi:hypothetical protein